MPPRLKVALVGGPMYDALYEARLPAFSARTGITVDVAAHLIHSALNDHLTSAYSTGTGPYDLISTHTKYAPAQAAWLRPLDDLLPPAALSDFAPETIELARVDGRLLGVPRNIDTRLFHYRTDLLADSSERRAFQERFGYDLAPPATWHELADVARHFARPPHLYGFAFPGRSSGLWGTFYELTEMAGGHFFGSDLRPCFNSPAGAWALGFLRDLHTTWRVTPPDLPDWQFDDVSRAFQEGRLAMIADWPGSYHHHAASPIGDRFDLALYPTGPAGRRVYSGGFTWAIPANASDLTASLALLQFLTNDESQRLEGQTGTLVPRRSVQQSLRDAAPPGSRDARRLELLDQTVATSLLVPPRFARYPEVEDAVWPALQAALTGTTSVKRALAAAAERMNAILSR